MRGLAATLVLLALPLGGCPTRHARPENAIDDPAVLIQALEKRGEAIQGLSALAALEVWRKSERVRVRQLLLVQRPDRLRVDTLSPFDQPLSMMASDGRTISIYSLEERRFWTGPATPRNLARLLPLRLEGEELVALLRGGAPVIPHTRRELRWDEGEGVYLLVLEGEDRKQHLRVEPAALRVVESHVWRGESLDYQARFGDYGGTGPTAIPRRMRFEVPAEALRIDVDVLEHTVDPEVPEDAFRIEPPRGIEVEPLD